MHGTLSILIMFLTNCLQGYGWIVDVWDGSAHSMSSMCTAISRQREFLESDNER